jgi:hypothetical protein
VIDAGFGPDNARTVLDEVRRLGEGRPIYSHASHKDRVKDRIDGANFPYSWDLTGLNRSLSLTKIGSLHLTPALTVVEQSQRILPVNASVTVVSRCEP